MTTKWERVYVFISSTFNDMHGERDYLIKQVFPQLQEWCEQRKLRLVDIDLRWGVTEQDALHNKNVVKVCLDRIDDCRPFFLCFLGQRRGWVPKEDEISLDTFDCFPDLRGFVGRASVTEMEILHALLSPLHGSKPRDPAKRAEYYERAKYAFFYLRDPSYLNQLPTDPPLLRDIYTNEGVEDPHEREKHDQELEKWRKEDIPESGRPVRPYQARWNPSGATPELMIPLQCPSEERVNVERWRKQWATAGIHVTGLNVEDEPDEAEKARNYNRKLSAGRLTDFKSDGAALSQVVVEDLQQAIAARYPDHVEVVSETDLEKELDQQEQFLFLSSEGFIERGDDFAELDQYIEGDSDRLFVLTAPGGMGKSTLLASWVDRYRTRIAGRPDRSIHFRFVGASDRSNTVHSLLWFLLREMKEIVHKLHKRIPDDPVKLRQAWPGLLKATGERGKTVIVIDALNQLESGLADLDWLPWRLPQDIKLIVSFKRGEEAAEELYQRLSDSGQVILSEVRPFEDPNDRRRLVRGYLSQYLKDLDDRHLETLIQSPGANNPLYLKIVLSELRVFGVFVNLGAKIRTDFGDTPVSAFHGVLARLETDPAYSLLEPQRAVPLLFGLLIHARHGLSADELTTLFVQALGLENNSQWREAAADTVHLFLRQVRPFLARREGRYDFFFESFRTAAQERYVATSAEELLPKRPATDWHHMLANYFESQPLYVERDEEMTPNLRKLFELPYQQAHAEMWDEVKATLTDFDFLQTKIEAVGPQPLIGDYEETLNAGSNSQTLRLIERALRLSAHVLVEDRAQSAGQLTGRLLSSDLPPIRGLLDQMLGWDHPWLRPLTPSLSPPGGPLIRTLSGHTRWVNGVAITPDGRRAVSASHDNTLKVWDLHSGTELATLTGHTTRVCGVAVTPDGRRAVSACWDDTLRVWDLHSGAELATLTGHTGHINAVALTPDGRRALSASVDKTLKVWDLDSGTELATLKGHTDPVNAVAVCPDGRRVVSASGDGTVKVWGLESGEELATLKGHTSWVNGVAVTPDGRRAVSASHDNTLKLWDLDSGTELATLTGHTGWVRAVAVTPDGRRAVSASRYLSLKLWDLDSGTELATLTGHTDEVSGVAVTPDGRRAVSASRDKTLKVWDLDPGTELATPTRHAGSVNAVAVTPDGLRAVSAASMTLKVWDLDSGTDLATLTGHTGHVHAVAVTPDGRRAVSASDDKTLKVWDLDSGTELTTLTGHSGWVRAVAVTPDGRRAVSGSGGRRAVSGPGDELRVWDLDSGTQLATLTGHTHWVGAVAVTPDGRRAVSASYDKTLKVWDLDSGTELATLTGHTGWVRAVAVTPDGRRAVSASEDRTIKVWDPDSTTQLATITGHTGSVYALAVTPDGYRVVSASEDKTIKVWDLRDRTLLATFTATAAGSVHSCAVAPDGVTIIAGDTSGRVHILRLEGVIAQETPRPRDARVVQDEVPADVDEVRERAARLLESGKVVEALKCFEAAAKLEPDDMNLLFYCLKELRSLGRHQEALRTLDDILRKQLASGESLGKMLAAKADALQHLRRYKEALTYYQKALDIIPGKSNIWFRQGHALQELGEFEKALTSFMNARDLKDQERSSIQIGYCLFALERYVEAEAEFSALVSAGSEEPLAISGLGFTEAMLGKSKEARSHIERFIEMAGPEDQDLLSTARKVLESL